MDGIGNGEEASEGIERVERGECEKVVGTLERATITRRYESGAR